MKKYLQNFIWFILLCLGACQSNSESSEIESSSPQKLSEDVLEVEVTPALRKNFTYSLQSNGKVEAREQAVLQFRTSGYVKQVLVQNGQFVQTGQAIALLDDREAQLALQKAKNQKAVAYEEYIKELIDFGGNPALPEGGIAPKLNERILIRKGVQAAELQIKEAELQLQFLTLKAPFAGTIADLTLKAGNFVSPSQAVCTLYSSALQAVIEVLETEVTTLKIGQKAEVNLLGCNESTCKMQAIISEINPKVGNNGLFKVKLDLQNPKNVFLGANLQVKVFVPQKEALVIPKQAIVIRSGKKVVFTEEQGLAKWHYVQTGLDNGEEIEILEGLKENEKVIISNNLQLNHDSPVRVKKK
ncbi:MAG: efflux RND transporter periplasmic adaptor subunit, partial [Candidatus Omnitrophica bacterium]|nr:efflux RND transporter periplasmic adaptor subunit [Candidatus Omnitrophota bacterium]